MQRLQHTNVPLLQVMKASAFTSMFFFFTLLENKCAFTRFSAIGTYVFLYFSVTVTYVLCILTSSVKPNHKNLEGRKRRKSGLSMQKEITFVTFCLLLWI